MNIKKYIEALGKGSSAEHHESIFKEIIDAGIHHLTDEITKLYQESVEVEKIETTEHQTWKNQIGNQVVQPLQLFKPTSLMDHGDDESLVAIISRANNLGCRVKAAGSGHSYSDVATTPDFFIDSHGMSAMANSSNPIAGQLKETDLNTGNLPLIIGKTTWDTYDPENNHALVEMENGITINSLNDQLWDANLGLTNMGGYGGQTIVGAISTSTHGSGITLGPFPDMVRSLVLATNGKYEGTTYGDAQPIDGVYLYRIEPKGGITNSATWNDPNILLIQDDKCFNATTTSMGCMGVIYSVVLEVSQNYWLSETRVMSNWKAIKNSLASTDGSIPEVLKNTRNFEFYQMPTSFLGGYPAVTSKRNIATESEIGNGHRSAAIAPLSPIAILALAWFVNSHPEFIPITQIIALEALVTIEAPYVDRSYKVYDLGVGGDAGFASEMAFPIGQPTHYDPTNLFNGVEHIFKTAKLQQTQGLQFQTSPMGVRFVKKSDSTLSMMNGKNMGMIEFDMVTGTYAGKETMYRLELGSYQFDARPHWGLNFDFFSGANNFVEKLYPNLPDWMSIYNQFNSKNTFANSFTDRMGFSKLQYPG